LLLYILLIGIGLLVCLFSKKFSSRILKAG
jgi:hypothetical protein